MRDPHVVSLKYALLVPAWLVYENVPATVVTHDVFHGQLNDGELELEMDAHFSSIGEARSVVDAFLKSWEVDAHLRGHKIAFTFCDGEVIDRNPPPHGSVVLAAAHATCSSSCTVNGNINVLPSAYPVPPAGFSFSNLIERMYGRFVAYQEKRESIFTSGYYCLTELQEAAGASVQRKGRGPAVARFKIERAVLDTLGELTSERGGPEFARKAGSPEPTPAESVWLAAAVPAIILHVAQVEAGAAVSELTMVKLPPL